MQIYFLRHTKVDVAPGLCYGQTDVKLAPSFPAEKEVIRQSLAGIIFDKVFSSPMLRCRHLAEAIAGRMNVQVDPRLMELNFGEWEGRHWDEISRDPYSGRWFKDFVRMPCPEGESYSQLLNRSADFIDQLKGCKSDAKVLVVTHGGVMRSIFSLVTGLAPERAFDLKMDYGAMLNLEF